MRAIFPYFTMYVNYSTPLHSTYRGLGVRTPIQHNVPWVPKSLHPEHDLTPFSCFAQRSHVTDSTLHATGSSVAADRVMHVLHDQHFTMPCKDDFSKLAGRKDEIPQKDDISRASHRKHVNTG